MTKRTGVSAFSATAIFCALTWVVAATGCSVIGSPVPGCTDEDERLAESLENLAVLKLSPAGATFQAEPSGTDCDDSSGVVIVERVYRFTDTSADVGPAEVAAFYRPALSEAGWTLEVPRSSSGPVDSGQSNVVDLCFSGLVEGAKARLYVEFPGSGAEGLRPRDINLSVLADADPDPEGYGDYTVCVDERE